MVSEYKKEELRYQISLNNAYFHIKDTYSRTLSLLNSDPNGNPQETLKTLNLPDYMTTPDENEFVYVYSRPKTDDEENLTNTEMVKTLTYHTHHPVFPKNIQLGSVAELELVLLSLAKDFDSNPKTPFDSKIRSFNYKWPHSDPKQKTSLNLWFEYNECIICIGSGIILN